MDNQTTTAEPPLPDGSTPPVEDTTLELAWQRFARYDANAKTHQGRFFQLQLLILVMGVTGTFLALLQTTLQLAGVTTPGSFWDEMLRVFIIIVPIVVSVLLAVSVRFNAGGRWVVLRASAEAIKRAIFRYRTRTGEYSEGSGTSADGTAAGERRSPQAELATALGAISNNLMQTDVNLTALHAYEGPIPPEMDGAAATDDGFSRLDAARYLAIRLGDQVSYFEDKTQKLERQLVRYQWLILVVGAVGTFLAAIGLELWIALTTTLMAAFTTYLEYNQTERTLLIYNQALTNLGNIQAWWTALDAAEKAKAGNFSRLVHDTENILAGEHAGWVQQLENALARLRQQQQATLAAAQAEQETRGPNGKPPQSDLDQNPAPVPQG